MKHEIIPGTILQSIYSLRGEKVMLDSDLAALYGVATKVLNQAVKRNARRFPADFMIRLGADEIDLLRSQIVTLKRGQHRKYRPYAFTEQGVAMLSSVLKSEHAWVAHASRVLVSASRRNDLSFKSLWFLSRSESPQWRDAIACTRDARATQQ
ncbi:MAG TPA: ORF6N domain-containing protein [Chthoniobacterales bacterium]|nr:ORF6N domain-containing protein [Chthoniobacterales bacterium]